MAFTWCWSSKTHDELVRKANLLFLRSNSDENDPTVEQQHRFVFVRDKANKRTDRRTD